MICDPGRTGSSGAGMGVADTNAFSNQINNDNYSSEGEDGLELHNNRSPRRSERTRAKQVQKKSMDTIVMLKLHLTKKKNSKISKYM